jgi:hypothetical protein
MYEDEVEKKVGGKGMRINYDKEEEIAEKIGR